MFFIEKKTHSKVETNTKKTWTIMSVFQRKERGNKRIYCHGVLAMKHGYGKNGCIRHGFTSNMARCVSNTLLGVS